MTKSSFYFHTVLSVTSMIHTSEDNQSLNILEIDHLQGVQSLIDEMHSLIDICRLNLFLNHQNPVIVNDFNNFIILARMMDSILWK